MRTTEKEADERLNSTVKPRYRKQGLFYQVGKADDVLKEIGKLMKR
jgi:hypothetical protein